MQMFETPVLNINSFKTKRLQIELLLLKISVYTARSNLCPIQQRPLEKHGRFQCHLNTEL